MQVETVDRILPSREKNTLHVEVNRVLGKESNEPVGVGYTIVSERRGPGKPDRWIINVHPAEMRELIEMLQKALVRGKEELDQLGFEEIK